MYNDKPNYMLSDEEPELYDDMDDDPFSEDVSEELDFDETFDREYAPELSIHDYFSDSREEDIADEADKLIRRADSEPEEHYIDNMRW